MPEFAVQVDAVGTTTVFRVIGVADIASAPSLGIQAAEVIRHGESDIVIDLSDATFIDSTALSVLLSIGLASAVICPPGRARVAITIARLEDTLRVKDTEAEALRCVGELRRRASAGPA